MVCSKKDKTMITFQQLSHMTRRERNKTQSVVLFGRREDGKSMSLAIRNVRPYAFVRMSLKRWSEVSARVKVLSQWSSAMQITNAIEKKGEADDATFSSIWRSCRIDNPDILASEEAGFNIRRVRKVPPKTVRLTFRNGDLMKTTMKAMRSTSDTIQRIKKYIARKGIGNKTPDMLLMDEKASKRVCKTEEMAVSAVLNMEHTENFETFESLFDVCITMMIDLKVKPCGWMSVTDPHPSHGDSSADESYTTLWTPNCLVHSDTQGIAPYRIMSYDIEALPHVVPNGEPEFPQPERDPITTIGVACYEFVTQREEMHAFCFRDTPDFDTADDPSDDDYDASLVNVHSFDDEGKMLEAFSEFIKSYDPDFISGYNINNFDNKYVFQRADALGCSVVAKMWGRVDHVCKLRKRFKQSNQTGGKEWWEASLDGREWFDLYGVIMTDHKLPSFKLDNVAAHFLGTRKVPVKYSDIPRMFETRDGRKALGVYCVKDAWLPIQLVVKLSKIQNAMSLSNVTGASIRDILNRGQQIRTMTLMLRYLRNEMGGRTRLYLPDEDDNHCGSFEGAVVIDPIPGFYETPVVTLDFASLYPSIMRAFNMCYSTICTRQEARLNGWSFQGDTPDVRAIRNFKCEDGKFEYIDSEDDVCFATKETRQGVLPCILQTLLVERKLYKKRMKAAGEKSPMYSVFNGHQLALKICANSIYGFTGAARGYLPEPRIASSVTRRGRAMANETKHVCETEFPGCRVIYGDTDSVFVNLPPTICNGEDILKEAERLGEVMADVCTKKFLPPNELEYEKTYRPILLKGKKRYAGYKFEPGLAPKMDVKGFECVRRDFAPIVSETQKMVLKKLVQENDRESAAKYANDRVRALMDGSLDVSLLTISRQLTRPVENYATKAAHVTLAARMQREMPESVAPKVGDRIPYVIRCGREPLYMRAIMPSEVSSKNKIDVAWYLKKQLRQPLMRIFEMVLDNPETVFQHGGPLDRFFNVKRKKVDTTKRVERKKKEKRQKVESKNIKDFFSGTF